MEKALQDIVEFLKMTASEGDAASIQINNDGVFIFRVGVSHVERLTLEQFVRLINE